MSIRTQRWQTIDDAHTHTHQTLPRFYVTICDVSVFVCLCVLNKTIISARESCDSGESSAAYTHGQRQTLCDQHTCAHIHSHRERDLNRREHCAAGCCRRRRRQRRPPRSSAVLVGSPTTEPTRAHTLMPITQACVYSTYIRAHIIQIAISAR